MDNHTPGDGPERHRRRARIQEMRVQEISRLRAAGHPPSDGMLAGGLQAPTSAVRTRAQAGPSERYLQRHRHRQQQHLGPSLSDSIGTVQQAVERLNEASSNLSSLLDVPMPRMISPDITAQEYSGEAEVNRRRSKRRRLDSEPIDGGFKGFSYGHRGQVVTGPLRMEIVSCDGGHYPGHAAQHVRHYWPENVLRNDKSVYCTEGNRCNIILRHQGDTTFCLKKLVIKAPERGFDAPYDPERALLELLPWLMCSMVTVYSIQEGLIFVSMTSDDLLQRTSHYVFQESSPPSRPSTSASIDDFYGTTRSSIVQRLAADGTIRESNENRPPSRRADYPTSRAIPPPISGSRFPRAPDGSSPRDQILEDPALSPGFTSLPSLDFIVTTAYDDHSGDEEEESSPAVLADRYSRDLLPSSSHSSSEDDEQDPVDRWASGRPRTAGVPTGLRLNRRRATPSRIVYAAPEDDEIAALVPHANFFIERKESMVSIKFDPPVYVSPVRCTASCFEITTVDSIDLVRAGISY